MTDDELLQLIEETPPEELTPQQLELLRERLPQSPALQQALQGQLRLEHALGAVLGRMRVSVDAILAKAGRPRHPPRRRLLIATVATTMVAVAMVLWWWRSPPQPRPNPNPAVVQQPGPGDPDGTQPKDPVPGNPGDRVDPPVPMPGNVVMAPDPAGGGEDEPWSKVLKEQGEPPAFDEVCFDDFPASQSAVSTDELARWFVPIDPGRLRVQISSRSAFVDGLARLRPTWQEGLALRLAMHSQQDLRLHVFSGTEGVTLWSQEYAEPGWAAYVTTRKPLEPRPTTYALAATDGGRFRRLGRGTVELHYEAGTLTLTRGDIRLLTAPLPAAPTEIFIEGRAGWRGIELFRAVGLPPAADPCPLVRRVGSPASLPWRKSLPSGSQLQPQPDGSLRLEADSAQEKARAWIDRPDSGPHEYVFEIEDPSQGSGLFLGDHQGQPLAAIGVFREQKSGQLVLDYSTHSAHRDTVSLDDRRQAVGYVRGRCWLKLVLGAGAFKCFISADGLNFSPLGEKFETNVPAGCHTLGLYTLPGGERRITLRQLQVRELDAIASLAEPELRDRALALDDMPEVGNWLANVVRHQPADVEDSPWRLACAVRTLAGRPSPRLAAGLLEALAAEGITQPTPLAQRAKLIEQVILLSNTLDEPTAFRLANLYQQLGQNLLVEGETRPYTVVAPSLQNAPFWGPAMVSLIPEGLVRREFAHLIYGGNWDRGADLAWQVKYFNRTADLNSRSLPPGREDLERLADWMQINAVFASPDQRSDPLPLAQAAAASPEERRLRRRATDRLTPPKFSDWRHPFVEQVSKEGYNILAEFQAALNGDAYEDACQVITAGQPAGSLGLLPDAHDSQLFVSLPAAVALAMQDRPELRRTMQEKYGGIGQLRLRQAMRDGDAATVLSVSVQFHGTAAAAEAHLWLGDRALSSGDFASSMGHYRTALETAPASLVHSITARLRLAAAMIGREAGEPATQEVQFGGERMPPSEFEQLVQELQQRRKPAASTTAAEGAAAYRLPAPARLEAESLWQFAGTKGRDANSAPQKVDWVARQLAIVPHGSKLYISDGFITSAFDVAGKKQLWATPLAGSPLTHGWSCVPTPPVVTASRIYVRQVTQRGSQVVCLETNTGKQLWESRADLQIASNPILQQDELFAIAVSSRRDGNLTLSLINLDARTGDLLSRRPMLQLADYWESRLPCQVVAVENRIVGNCGGCVFTCNLLGQPRWLRRQIWLSPAADSDFIQQHHQPPLVAGKQIFSTQRGVRAVEAIDLDTGRLQWRAAIGDIRRLLGVQAGVLVVEAESGWLGLAPETGERLWRRPARGAHLEGVLAGDAGTVLVAEAQPWEGGQFRPVLSWLNPATGEETAHAPLESLISKNPRLGPLAVWRDRLFGFAALEADRDPERRLFEFKKSGPAYAARPNERPLLHWSSASPTLHAAAAQLTPGWVLTASLLDKQTGLRQKEGQPAPSITTLADTIQPVSFVRSLHIPAGSKAKLSLEAAAEGDEAWLLEVAANDETLLRQEVTKDGFRREIDLSSYAGKKAWLSVRQSYPQRGDAYGKWQKLQVQISP